MSDNDDVRTDHEERQAAAHDQEEPTTRLTWDPSPDPQMTTPRTLRVAHLVMGLVFLGLAGIWLAEASGIVTLADLDLLLPLLLVVVGAAGLLAGLARGVGRRT